jgi:hypothetical protein
MHHWYASMTTLFRPQVPGWVRRVECWILEHYLLLCYNLRAFRYDNVHHGLTLLSTGTWLGQTGGVIMKERQQIDGWQREVRRCMALLFLAISFGALRANARKHKYRWDNLFITICSSQFVYHNLYITICLSQFVYHNLFIWQWWQ